MSPKLNISQTFTEVDAEAIRRGPTMPDTPLPLSVELADEIYEPSIGEFDRKVEYNACSREEALALIDARVRPLVEALRNQRVGLSLMSNAIQSYEMPYARRLADAMLSALNKSISIADGEKTQDAISAAGDG